MKSLNVNSIIGCIFFILITVNPSIGQVITWGNSNPAVSSDNITTCQDSETLTINFVNGGAPLTDVTIEIQLDLGILYVPGSLSTLTGPTTISEFDITDLNRPIFTIGALNPAEEVEIVIERMANCEARDKKIAGGTFADVVHVFESGTEVSYSNGITEGTAEYDVIYAALSITGVATTPPTNNLGGSSIRTLNITNGSFGVTSEFYFADIFNAGDITLSNFTINASGINYSIPIANISMVGDSVIIHFTANEISAIDGSGGTTGDGDVLFEIDEQFELQYEVTPNNCGIDNLISSELLAWWGCSYVDRCQIAESATSLGLTNSTPAITLSNAIKPPLEICDTVIYSVELTNTSVETTPAGGSFASDVTAFLGLRSNNSAIATLTNVTQWGSDRFNNKFFTDYRLNGIPVTLPTTPGLVGSLVHYLPPDYFTTDPDGPGGLDDIDGDGFYDDLAIGESVTISYGVYNVLREPNCGVGRADYGRWEHISADISWYNQCGVLMSPVRQEFNYTNIIRDYQNSTTIDAPTDISDGDVVDVGIRAHLFNTYNCNGSSGYSSPDMDWITSIPLPAGFSLAPGYDPTIYSQSGDTVFITSKYTYEFRYFPLTFDCSEWDGSNPIVLPFHTTYVCNKDGIECYREDMHCFETTIIPKCPSPCVGVTPLYFEVDRISESWTDDTQTTLVDINDPNITTDFVYPFDTVAFTTEAVMVDTMTDNLFVRFIYSPDSGGNIFDYLDGEITIVDIDGQYNGGTTHYTFPLTTSPTINSLGGNDYEAIFDISSYASLIDPNYEYGESAAGPPMYDADSIQFVANFAITNTMNPIVPWKVNNFRGDFFLFDAAGNEISCNSWGATLSYEKVSIEANAYQNTHSGCGSTFHLFYLRNQALTDDDHPNEYRPWIHIDSAIVSIPTGWAIGDVIWFDGVVMSPSDYDLQANGTLTVRRPSGFSDWDKQNTFFPRFQVEMIPTCTTPNGISNIEYTNFYKEYAYLTDPTSHIALSSTDDDGTIHYTGPTMTVTPLNQSAPAIQDTISWTVRVCNSTSDMDVPYNWLLINNNTNTIMIDSVLNVTNGTNILLPTTTTNSGEIYVEIDDLNRGTCKDVQIFAQFNTCEIDTLTITQGWACNSYPNPVEAMGCEISNNLIALPQSAQISTTITPLADTPSDPLNPTAGNYGSSTASMCTEFPAELQVVNAQPGYLYDIIVNILMPSGGNGTSYVPGSATIEVEGIDAVGVPRPIGAVAEAALITASNIGAPIWFGNLSDIDPTNFGNGEALPGTSKIGQNEFIIRWKMEATCEIISGDNFVATIYGNDPCGEPAQGNGEQVNGYPINIDGIVSPYFSFLSTTISPENKFSGCDDVKTVEVDLLITGGSTGSADTLLVTLPPGLSYDSNFICNTPGKCPTYVSSTIVGGLEVVHFSYPAGQTGSINFEFDLSASTRGACGNNEVINLKNIATISGVPCSGGTDCTSADVVTGQDASFLIIEKPILDIGILKLESTNGLVPNIFTYDIELSNGGIPTDNDVIVEFYCLNAAGDDISGPAIAKDTLTNVLPTNGFEILSGSFSTVCNPEHGVAAMIVPEYDNCYCDALESMSQRIGFDDIPFDTLANVPLPVELRNFNVTEDGCEIKINWATQYELNNKNFHIQRSSDNFNFQTMAIIRGKGNSDLITSYSHIDPIEAKDKQLYYRLKMVSYSDEIEYSPVRTILPKNCGEEVGDFLSAYPNPVKNGNEVNIVYENESNSSIAKLQIISMIGVVAIEKELTDLQSGINAFNVDLSSVPGGNYFLQIENNEGRFSRVRLAVMKD